MTNLIDTARNGRAKALARISQNSGAGVASRARAGGQSLISFTSVRGRL